MKSKKYYQERKFLNKERSKRAFVIASVEQDGWESPDKTLKRTITATVEIADCSKTIYLEFDVNTEKDRKRVLDKIALLNTVLLKFEQALTHAVSELPVKEKKKRGSKQSKDS